MKENVAILGALAMFLVSASPVLAQDDEAPVGPPGPVCSADAFAVARDARGYEYAPMCRYGEQAMNFASDEDWCSNVLLQFDLPAEAHATCMRWVNNPAVGGGIFFVLPESWAVPIAKEVGWYAEEDEAPQDEPTVSCPQVEAIPMTGDVASDFDALVADLQARIADIDSRLAEGESGPAGGECDGVARSAYPPEATALLEISALANSFASDIKSLDFPPGLEAQSDEVVGAALAEADMAMQLVTYRRWSSDLATDILALVSTNEAVAVLRSALGLSEPRPSPEQ